MKKLGLYLAMFGPSLAVSTFVWKETHNLWAGVGAYLVLVLIIFLNKEANRELNEMKKKKAEQVPG